MEMKRRLVLLLAALMCLFFSAGALAELGEPPPEPKRGYSSKATPSAVVAVNHNLRRGDVMAMVDKLGKAGLPGQPLPTTRYKTQPSLVAPYKAGSLADADLAEALKATKMVRFLAGVPYEDVVFTEEENNIAQHGAVLLAASNQFTHYPKKPADMSDEFFKIAYDGCSGANLYPGLTNLADAVLGFIADPGTKNLSTAGHRRWILLPAGRTFGMGYAKGSNNTRISMRVHANANSSLVASDSFIAWPNGGDFPIQYFRYTTGKKSAPDFPWSITLGAPYQAPSKSSIKLSMTRTRDQKTWVFDSKTPVATGSGMHLAVDDGTTPMRKHITFRPDLASLGALLDGDTFNITLDGINHTDGSPAAKIEYSVRFFDMDIPASHVALESIRFDKSEVSMEVEGTVLLTPTLVPSNASAALRWSSSDTNVATVSHGTITGKKEGSCTITVSSADDNSVLARCNVLVMPKPVAGSGITLSTTNLTMEAGATHQLTAEVWPINATDKSVTWTISDPSVATVSDSGLVTAVKVGSAHIWATTRSNKVAICSVDVVPTVTGIAYAQPTVYLKKGTKARLEVTPLITDGSFAELTWESSAPKVVFVYSGGFIKAKKAGKAAITATAFNGTSCTIQVIVGGSTIKKLALQGVPPTREMAVGATLQLKASFKPTKARGVIRYTSSDQDVISIDASGLATAIKPGVARITVKMGSRKASTTITVK